MKWQQVLEEKRALAFLRAQIALREQSAEAAPCRAIPGIGENVGRAIGKDGEGRHAIAHLDHQGRIGAVDEAEIDIDAIGAGRMLATADTFRQMTRMARQAAA